MPEISAGGLPLNELRSSLHLRPYSQVCGKVAPPRRSVCEACAEAPGAAVLALTARVARLEGEMQVIAEIWCVLAPPSDCLAL